MSAVRDFVIGLPAGFIVPGKPARGLEQNNHLTRAAGLSPAAFLLSHSATPPAEGKL
jgi:hypothetical protein